MWLGNRKRPPNIWQLCWGIACIVVSCPQSLESHVIKENLTPNTQNLLIQQPTALSHNNIISYLFTKMQFHLSLRHSGSSMAKHSYYELIDPIKEAFPLSLPQRASVVENPLTVRDIHCYPSFQPQRASTVETPLIVGDVH